VSTLTRLVETDSPVPAAVSWYAASLAEFRGRQELFTQRSPQKLKALRENAIIESAIASNRIEGVEIGADRVRPVLVDGAALRDRDEVEVRGYQDALKWIHEERSRIPLTEETIRTLHRMCRGEIWDAGQYKDKEIDIIERFADGTSRVRFRTVSAAQTPAAMAALSQIWPQAMRKETLHGPVALSAFNLDFLCIHPFRDGNGRVSRLLLLLGAYHMGFEVGRYISLERLIEDTKADYYETLRQSSQGWHEGQEDAWKYIAYVCTTLKSAYRKFEDRLAMAEEPRGAKTLTVEEAIARLNGSFTVADLEHACPGVSLYTIQNVLRRMRDVGTAECLSPKGGPGARWRRIDPGGRR
jgi:Fic family protein